MGTKPWVLLVAALLVVLPCAARADQEKVDKPRIGVYYFPGWKPGAPGLHFSDPWSKVEPFGERRPLLGSYPEGNVHVMEQQLRWMHEYGIGFVAFDWYWNGTSTYLDHAIDAYLNAKARRGVQFALLWANHDQQPSSPASFERMVSVWLDRYFVRPEYLRIDGKPLVFVFLAGGLDESAKSFGSSARELLGLADAMARSRGLPGIFFVGGASAEERGPQRRLDAQFGLAAYSAYNYHAGPGGRTGAERRMSHSYAELDEGYRQQWDWFRRYSDLPYIVPMTSGWDKRPWGGSRDAAHDQSRSTPAEFQAHLAAARKFIRANKAATLNMGVICCWNEFGEGSFVEPTLKYGLDYLEAVRTVFASSP